MNAARSFLDGRVMLYAGDCRDVLKTLADNSVDSVVTDPPYFLTSIAKRFSAQNAAPCTFGKDGSFARLTGGFVGKTWDDDVAFHSNLWAEVLRVLKPGGHLAVFGGTRTAHRMVCAIEDAGFEVRDQLVYCFGSGFPKNHSVGRKLDLDDDRCKCFDAVAGQSEPQDYGAWPLCDRCGKPMVPDGLGTALSPAFEPICLARKPLSEKTVAANVLRWGTGAINVDGGRISPLGRWPANLCHDGSEEVLACFPERNGGRPVPSEAKSKPYGEIFGSRNRQPFDGYNDSGSAARFFASFPQDGGSEKSKRIFYTKKADNDSRLGSFHPTVKPLDLIQYLVRLITPPGGGCLDLFAGTGTTAEACFRGGFSAILIEQEAEYIADIERRMSLVMEGPVTRAHASTKARGRVDDAGPLFGGFASDHRKEGEAE